MDYASLVSAMSSHEMLEKSCLSQIPNIVFPAAYIAAGSAPSCDSNQHLNTAETTLGIGWRF